MYRAFSVNIGYVDGITWHLNHIPEPDKSFLGDPLVLSQCS